LSFTLAAFALALFAPENCGTVVTGIGVGLGVGVAFPFAAFATFAINALGVRDVVKPPRLLRLDLDRLDLDLDRVDLDLDRLDLDLDRLDLDLDRLDLDLDRLDLDLDLDLIRLLPPLWCPD
jgi:hypothetical protein